MTSAPLFSAAPARNRRDLLRLAVPFALALCVACQGCVDSEARCRKGNHLDIQLDGRAVRSAGRVDPASDMDLDYVFGIGLQGDWSFDLENREVRLRFGTDSRLLDNERFSSMSSADVDGFYAQKQTRPMLGITRQELVFTNRPGTPEAGVRAHLTGGEYTLHLTRESGCRFLHLQARASLREPSGKEHSLSIRGRQAQ